MVVAALPATLPQRRNQAELLEHTQGILFAYFFRHLAVSNAEDADPRPRGRLAGRRDAPEGTFLGSHTFPAGHHLVPFGNEVPFYPRSRAACNVLIFQGKF